MFLLLSLCPCGYEHLSHLGNIIFLFFNHIVTGNINCSVNNAIGKAVKLLNESDTVSEFIHTPIRKISIIVSTTSREG